MNNCAIINCFGILAQLRTVIDCITTKKDTHTHTHTHTHTEKAWAMEEGGGGEKKKKKDSLVAESNYRPFASLAHVLGERSAS